MSERTAVYRAYGAGEVLLYVSGAKSFGLRWAQHAAAKPWWPDVQRQTVDWYPDRTAALAAETDAIRAECPRHNVAGTPGQMFGRRNLHPAPAGYYMGSAEIGRMLGGISRQRVQQLISRADFPQPEVVLDMGKVWKRADVAAWAKAHGREVQEGQPGRPPRCDS